MDITFVCVMGEEEIQEIMRLTIVKVLVIQYKPVFK